MTGDEAMDPRPDDARSCADNRRSERLNDLCPNAASTLAGGTDSGLTVSHFGKNSYSIRSWNTPA